MKKLLSIFLAITILAVGLIPCFAADDSCTCGEAPIIYVAALGSGYVYLDAGTETFFRLGQTIEHQIKKHGTLPPSDFGKWAQICEHIIMHYNEGWADGYNLGIKYWEIFFTFYP